MAGTHWITNDCSALIGGKPRSASMRRPACSFWLFLRELPDQPGPRRRKHGIGFNSNRMRIIVQSRPPAAKSAEKDAKKIFASSLRGCANRLAQDSRARRRRRHGTGSSCGSGSAGERRDKEPASNHSVAAPTRPFARVRPGHRRWRESSAQRAAPTEAVASPPAAEAKRASAPSRRSWQRRRRRARGRRSSSCSARWYKCAPRWSRSRSSSSRPRRRC